MKLVIEGYHRWLRCPSCKKIHRMRIEEEKLSPMSKGKPTRQFVLFCRCGYSWKRSEKEAVYFLWPQG